jgi:hypothetical protein
MPKLTPRTQAQREWIIEQRLRAIATGEWMEKAGLADLVGPPIGANFRLGESLHNLRARRAESPQDLHNRAARAGIYLPGQTPLQEEIVRTKKLERDTGIATYAMPVKDRFGISLGLGNAQSSWEIPDLVEYDYAYLNLAGATTYNGGILGVMPGTNAAKIGSPDPLGAATAGADTASRKSGTGLAPYFAFLSFWVFARTGAGAVYTAAAGTTLQPFVCSAVAAAQLFTALTAATYNVNAGTTFWTQLTLVAPADRQVAIGSPLDPQSGILYGFYGDFLFSQLITTGALNIQGNSLLAECELA